MNKTVTANISGIVFHIETDAYEKLQKYLDTIKSYFSSTEGRDEIMADIEARIAELFKVKLGQMREVVVMKDVEEVIETMGQPEDYIDGDASSEEQERESETKTKQAKRIYRDPDHSIIGGVCSGIAAYFGLDPIWIRLAFVLLLVAGGAAIPIYIILWIIIPEAKTTAEKLRMRGEEVNIDNIRKTIEDEAEKINERFQKWNKNHESSGKIGNFFMKIGHFIGHLFLYSFRAIGKVLGFAFIIAGITMTVIIVQMIIDPELILINNLNDGYIQTVSLENFREVIFEDENNEMMAMWGLLLLVGIPVIGLIYSGLSLILKIKAPKGIGFGLGILWIIGIVLSCNAALIFARNIEDKASIKNTVPIRPATSKTLYLKMQKNEMSREIMSEEEDDFIIRVGTNNIIQINEDSVYYFHPRLDIKKSKDDSIRLLITKSSHANTNKNALLKSEHISYTVHQHDSNLVFPGYFTVPIEDKLRLQKVEMTLFLPEKKAVFIDESMKSIIYDIKNVSNTYDHEMLNKKWGMLDKGLTCIDCDEIQGISNKEFGNLTSRSDTLN